MEPFPCLVPCVASVLEMTWELDTRPDVSLPARLQEGRLLAETLNQHGLALTQYFALVGCKRFQS